MRRKDLRRAADLAEALTGWDVFDRAFANKEKGAPHLEINVGPLEDDGGYVQANATVTVDGETGRKIVAAAQEIIEAELKALEEEA